MALPSSRNTTYVAGVSQVHAADLNALQDQIVALYNLLTATAQAVYSGVAISEAVDLSGGLKLTDALPTAKAYVTMTPAGLLAATAPGVEYPHSIGLVAPGDATASLLTGNSGGGTSPRFNLSTSVVEHVLPLAVPLGVITAYSVKLVKASASGTINVKLMEGANGSGIGGLTQIGATQSNNANNPGEITLGQSGLSFTMTAGRQYYLVIQGSGTTGDAVSIYSATVAPV